MGEENGGRKESVEMGSFLKIERRLVMMARVMRGFYSGARSWSHFLTWVVYIRLTWISSGHLPKIQMLKCDSRHTLHDDDTSLFFRPVC